MKYSKAGIAVALIFSLGCVQAGAQSTLNSSNFSCMVKAAQKCITEQSGRTDNDRGGQSAGAYCADEAEAECG